MRKIVLIVFGIISIRIDLCQALTSHYSVIDLENDLIYQRIQTLRDLERFYRKLTDDVEYNHRNNSQVMIGFDCEVNMGVLLVF